MRDLEQKAQERRVASDMDGQQEGATLRHKSARSTRSTSVNGNVPAASFTSLNHCAVHCLCAAAVAVCHMTNHSCADLEQRAMGVVGSQCCLSGVLFYFKLHIGNNIVLFILCWKEIKCSPQKPKILTSQ